MEDNKKLYFQIENLPNHVPIFNKLIEKLFIIDSFLKLKAL